MSREAAFQDRLRDLIFDVSRNYRFEGLEISHVERDFPVDSKKVDIAIFLRGRIPFLFIETKREASGRAARLFDPLSPAVVGQAISYAYDYWHRGVKVPYFATANPTSIAVFRTPENLREFVRPDRVRARRYDEVFKPDKYTELLERYLIIREELRLSEEYVQSLLDRLAKDYLKERVIKAELSYALIEQFRSFVRDISSYILDLLKYRMEHDEKLKSELQKIAEETGSAPDAESLSRMMAYILMNKLIFYKVLEGKYKLPPLIGLPTDSSAEFKRAMQRCFDKAVEVTGDFEPIFITGLYDLIPIPDDPEVMDRVNDFIAFLNSIDVEEVGELAGYIYEELIPPEERHQLGQFYTPPAICELITKWAIRSPDDKVLDPGVGSGGFILQAYRRLLKLKIGREALSVSKEVHVRILKQLYSVDINPFATHITAMNLSMKNVRSPSRDMNIIVDDFFTLLPNQMVLSPFTIKTSYGDIRRKITIPKMDVVVGNPPYTRWDEISERTKNIIRKHHGKNIKKYNLFKSGGVRAAQNPGIYIFWIMHATEFLKEGGRLGVIISNLWLQTNYGIGFGRFLKDNYKIHAVIDFSQRLFRIPLISTLVILAEKCSNKDERDKNEVVFAYVNKEVRVEALLEAIKNREEIDGVMLRVVNQSELPDDDKWIRLLPSSRIPSGFEEEVWKQDLFIKADKVFDISRGSVEWTMKKLAGIGADPFFHLTPSKIKEFNIPKEYVHPALVKATYARFFTFTEKDWKELEKHDKDCYMFICHMPRNKLPQAVKNYIKWGESECRVSDRRGKGRRCNETSASEIRAKSKGFYGWYDLGPVKYVPLFAIRQARYKTRFIKCDFPIAMYDGLVSFIPKENYKLDNVEWKAMLAYLNSSFVQYYIETNGRYISKGPIAFEVNTAKEMPILDVKKLTDEHKAMLAQKFDELEAEARKIGGAYKKEQLKMLMPKIYEIDKIIGEILGLDEDEVDAIQKTVDELINRRVSGSKAPAPESVKGKRTLRERPSKRKKMESIKKLDEFL